MHETLGKNGVLNNRYARGNREERGELSLHVCGETWEWSGDDIGSYGLAARLYRAACAGFIKLNMMP